MAGAVLVSLVLLGAFMLTRAESVEPTRYRTEVTLVVPSLHREAAEPPEDMPRQLIRGQRGFAQATETRAAALESAGLPPDVGGVGFSVSLSETETVMTLSVTATDQEVSAILAERYADAVVDVRRQVVMDENNSRAADLIASIDTLRVRARTVERELRAKLDGGLPPVQRIDEEEGGPAPFLDQPTDVALQIFERDALYREIASSQVAAAQAQVNAATPSPYAERMGIGTPQKITPSTNSPIVPVAVILLGGLALGLVGAVAADRFDQTIRSAKTAAQAFEAPLLSAVPSGWWRGRHAVLENVGSARTDAYRSLAATAVATDRLPKAIMVTTPRGDAHDEVAGNLAAALAGLGLKVALVATSPRQEWFLRPFSVRDDAPTLPQLLAEAHQGRLDGALCTRLPRAKSVPDLVAVPPGDDLHLELPLDGLPPLLEALSQADIDVTVIAGPALLEDPNATIIAWATGTVLWACQLGDCVADDAELAASRLELAGVHAFGLATLGAET